MREKWLGFLHRKRRGQAGEWLACVVLFFRGYRILARNLHTPHAEIDILARHRGVLVVVEVKSRTRDAERVLTGEQQARLVRASDWAQKKWGRPGVEPRLDLVKVRWKRWPSVRVLQGIRYQAHL